MTAEEAGQIILEGKPWRPCTNCNGQGLIKDSLVVGGAVYTSKYGTVSAMKRCVGCNGDGHFLHDEYRQACELLGLKVPLGSVYQMTADIAPQQIGIVSSFQRHKLTVEGDNGVLCTFPRSKDGDD